MNEIKLVDYTNCFLEYKYDKFINLDSIENNLQQNYSVGILPFPGGKPQQLFEHKNISVILLDYDLGVKNDKWSNYGFYLTNFDNIASTYNKVYSYLTYQEYITIGHLLKSNMEIIKNTDYVFIQPLKYTLPQIFQICYTIAGMIIPLKHIKLFEFFHLYSHNLGRYDIVLQSYCEVLDAPIAIPPYNLYETINDLYH
ncbi:Uncharacterized protein QTN25_001821 [Entamoeba marina]